MAEFITTEDARNQFASKAKGNAGLTLGIIGTALGALSNNNCNGGGILGNILGNGNNCAMKEAQEAKTMAMLQGQTADNLSWMNRVASMNDTAELARNIEPRFTQLNNQDWMNYVQSIKDDAVVSSSLNDRINDTNRRISDEVQVLTNQSWKRREEDLKEKSDIYVRSMQADQALASQAAKDKFDLYKLTTDSDAALDNKFTRMNYEGRIQDMNEKFDMYNKLSERICNLEKEQARTETALPLMFELNKVNSERYTDNCCCKSNTDLTIAVNALQRQIDHKIDGTLRYAYSDLCAPVPSIAPLYCTPYTPNGSGTYWNGYNQPCQSL